MNKQSILYILSTLFLLPFVSCMNEEGASLSGEGMGEIRFSVVADPEVAIETKASSGFDVNDFNVSLSRGETVVFSTRKYSDIAGSTITCSAGSGYLLKAESCTEGEAERVNNGRGQARLAGNILFAVKPVEPTEVTLKCVRANTSVSVEYSDFIKNNFSDYAITLYAADVPDRSFTFDQDNHSYMTTYFNVGTDGRALQYTVSLTSPGEKDPHTYQASLTLKPSCDYRLAIKLKDESQSKITIEITVDGELEDEKTFEETINPYEK